MPGAQKTRKDVGGFFPRPTPVLLSYPCPSVASVVRTVFGVGVWFRVVSCAFVAIFGRRCWVFGVGVRRKPGPASGPVPCRICANLWNLWTAGSGFRLAICGRGREFEKKAESGVHVLRGYCHCTIGGEGAEAAGAKHPHPAPASGHPLPKGEGGWFSRR